MCLHKNQLAVFGQEHKSTADAQPCQTMAQPQQQTILFAVRSGDANRDSPFLGFLAFTLPQQPKLSPHIPLPSLHGPIVHQLDLLVLCISTASWAANP